VVAGYLLYAVPGTLPNGAVSGAVGITLMVAALHPYARRQRGPRPARIGAAGPLLLAAALVWQPLASADGAASEARLVLGYDALVVLLAAGLVLAVTVDGSRVERLVVDLGASESDLLRDRLARALRDPTLTVGYWLAERSVYVDDSGAQVHLPAPGEARSATPIAMEGRPLALLVHDEAVSTDAGLLRDVAAAARWAVENIRLREQVRAQVAVVDASRRRLVTAGDEERRRLEDSLRVGPQRRLTAVRSLLADGADWQGLVASLEHAERDLVDLANGLHPRVLTDGGLQPALAQLADFCPVPVALHAPDMRLPGPVESALYFSCAEALTNVAKYAQARAVHVHITVVGGEAVLVVDDDGVGGAQLDGGSGLRGLGDRVDALGGRLVLVSQPGRGTQVTVRLPLHVGAMS
jgi:hypothetical protein